MAEPQIQQPGTIGKYWRQFAADDPAGTPLAEWAYVTPRFPQGIGQSALQKASPEVQRETAFVWFNLNLEPYALGEGPYFGFGRSDADGQSPETGGAGYASAPYASAPYGGRSTQPRTVPRIAGFGVGVWAPSRIEAFTVLAGEFGAVMPEPVIYEVVDRFPGDWMWRPMAAHSSIDRAGAAPGWPELAAIILARLDTLEDALRDIRPAHGDIGHNGPPEGFVLTPEDEREVQAAISRARTALASEGDTSGAELHAAADALKPVGVKLPGWALEQLKTFVTEANKSVAQEAGKALVGWLVAHEVMRELPSLLEQAARLLGHH